MPKLTKTLQKENADNLAGDLLKILDGLNLDAKTHNILMERLSIYCSHRDNVIWTHAYNLGKSGQDALEPEEEG